MPSTDQALRRPVPEIRMTKALPLVQSLRFTISWITDVMSVVRCAVPARPAAVHEAGVHEMEADVFGRAQMLLVAELKVGAFPEAWP